MYPRPAIQQPIIHSFHGDPEQTMTYIFTTRYDWIFVGLARNEQRQTYAYFKDDPYGYLIIKNAGFPMQARQGDVISVWIDHRYSICMARAR